MNDALVSTNAQESDSKTPGQSAARARHGNRRDQILEAALKLFAQLGMARVTTRQIAQAVGISQPSLYAHFRNADEIASELCMRAFETLSEKMRRCADVPGTARERLTLMGRAYIEFGLSHPDMYRVAFMLEDMKPCAPQVGDATDIAELEQLGSAASDPVLVAGIRCFSVMHQVVTEVLGHDNPQAMLAAQLVWVRVHGLVSLLIARPEFPWADRDALINGVMDQLPL